MLKGHYFQPSQSTMNDADTTMLPPYPPPTGFAHWAYTTSPFWSILPPMQLTPPILLIPIRSPNPSTTIYQVDTQSGDTTLAKNQDSRPRPSRHTVLGPWRSEDSTAVVPLLRREGPNTFRLLFGWDGGAVANEDEVAMVMVDERSNAVVADPFRPDDPPSVSKKDLYPQRDKKRKKAPLGETQARTKKQLKRARYKARKKERRLLGGKY
ncbi:hypothetical protein BDW42DRAFT_176397 [Aspergillus taichungensis]|uniref:Uncharacterized protein n=1 Tax=Aspergillus taichungensis TaxID=482145 RepID=A0A2J5HL49_9EURO|nr:hypothetical protein BDW42DRAFT_176397 [Aspergillus taichungensis]